MKNHILQHHNLKSKNLALSSDMETDLLIATINEYHQTAKAALEEKNINPYLSIFDNGLRYVNADGSIFNKSELEQDLKRTFNMVREYHTSYYRIKSMCEEGLFTEKIATKSVVLSSRLLFFTKKQTIQTEKIFKWKMVDGKWKVVEAEVVLEEKY